jgi:hypothetical protein
MPFSDPREAQWKRVLDEAEKKWQSEAKLLQDVIVQTHKDVLTVQKLTTEQKAKKVGRMAATMRECSAALSRIQQQF